MDLRAALVEQYRAALAMLRDCIEKCPEDLWTGGSFPRNPWRIAYHAIFYTHLYLMQDEASYVPWPKHREGATALWEDDEGPAPATVEPYTRAEALEALEHLDALIAPTVASLDLDAPETGFHWYPNMTKLSHQLLNLRHLQGHVGQLSELLMARGIETDWVSRPS
jgi:hypothetical protein